MSPENPKGKVRTEFVKKMTKINPSDDPAEQMPDEIRGTEYINIRIGVHG